MPASKHYVTAPPPVEYRPRGISAHTLRRKFPALTDEFILDAMHDTRQYAELNAAGINNPLAWQRKAAFRILKKEQRRRESFVNLDQCLEIAAPEDRSFEAKEECNKLLATLPQKLREAITLHKLEGYSCEEIAKMKGEKVEAI